MTLIIRSEASAFRAAGADPLAGAQPDPVGPFTKSDPVGQCTSCVGDPAGRRIVLLHDHSGQNKGWGRLLRTVPAGQEWVAIRCCPDASHAVQAAALRPLLTVRRGRRPLLVGCGEGAAVALRAALEHPGLIGGVLLVGASEAERPPLAARLLPRSVRRAVTGWSAAGAGPLAELEALAPMLGAIRVPVVLVEGDAAAATLLERSLTGCRTLTAVTVSGAPLHPTRHETDVRGALATLVAAVERGGA